MCKLMAHSLAVILGVFSPLVLAENAAYQIELLVFAQTMPNTESFEHTGLATDWPSGWVELSAYKTPDTTVLNDSYAALAKDPAYRPILHVAWIMPVEEGSLSAPVHIQRGKLNGYVQVQQNQGLQLLADFELSDDQDGKTMAYRLTEQRSLKFNEIYYLDHPKFGIIATISPL